MLHTFLALDMELIPQATKDNVPTFWLGLFSNDNTLMLIDGRNSSGDLVHPMTVLRAWTQWSPDPDEVIAQLLASAIEYTTEDIMLLKGDINSIWYVDTEGDI
jgi:hypothetical protein